MARLDPHSYADSDQPRIHHLDWRAVVDFDTRILTAEVALSLADPADGLLDLDTRDLLIDAVETGDGQPVEWRLSPTAEILGSRLRLDLPDGTTTVRIRYRTSPAASALQWMDPAQTLSKRAPYLFSQCQATHARSIIPLQDSPSHRVTWTAELVVPKSMRGLMAAEFRARDEHGEVAYERWRMTQPIPPYLMAIAVGRLESRELGPRSRVWAEPEQVEEASWEFRDVEQMLRAGEALFGPYEWGRFDILVMPPSFPYGGMENPQLVFVTPTLLAGDRSLVSVVAHELAHGWTGNLVTNANAEHFWLNEGFTVYAERRMIEALEGADMADLHAALGLANLERSLVVHADRPELTLLRTDLDGVDPDEIFSEVPYEKGYLLLRALEELVGRRRFDSFLRRYLTRFRLQAITTDDFAAFCEEQLPGALAAVRADDYFDRPGIPASAPRVVSRRLQRVQSLRWHAVDEATADSWTPAEWQLYLEGFGRPAPASVLDDLDADHDFTASRNPEILFAWLTLCAESGYAPARARTVEALGRWGRLKFLRPLYAALAREPATQRLARESFERFRPTYHPIARVVVETDLAKHGA